MLGFVLSVLGVLLVAVLLFVGASLLLGRGEVEPPADVGRSPLELPDDRPVTGDDLRDVRLSVSVRGYRMTEVDWLVDQLAEALDEKDLEIASLRARLREARAEPDRPAADGEERPGA